LRKYIEEPAYSAGSSSNIYLAAYNIRGGGEK